MAIIHCQSCKQPMDVPAEMGGQTMACPHCSVQFVAPRAPTQQVASPRIPSGKPVTSTPPPPFQPSVPAPAPFLPVQAPSPPTPAFIPVDDPHTPKPAGRLRERPVTLLDVFDLTFARFVTPIIVKIVWVILLVLAGLWLLLITWLLVMSLWATTAGGPSSMGSMGPLGGAPRLGAESRLVVALIQIVFYVFQVITTGAMLLWARLILESIMLLFSISGSLKSIDRKTRAE